jgi:hypothetical protein
VYNKIKKKYLNIKKKHSKTKIKQAIKPTKQTNKQKTRMMKSGIRNGNIFSFMHDMRL